MLLTMQEVFDECYGKAQTMRVILAPVAGHFSPEAGSEDGWMYDIVTGLVASLPGLNVVAISETGDLVVNDRIEQYMIGRRRNEEIGGATLPLRLAAKTCLLRSLEHVDLVHHGLPFALGKTYSMLARMASRRGIPFIVGPVQSPLPSAGSTEESGQPQLQIPCPTTSHSIASRITRTLHPVAVGTFVRLSDATLRSARSVVAIDESAADLIRRRGVLSDRIRVIPPPLRITNAEPPLPVAESTTVRVVTAGHVIERKAMGEVIVAVANLAGTGNRVTLDVVGDGPGLFALQRMAAAIPGGECVRFHGWLEKEALRRVLSMSHVYATMSRSESWGQALVEAMSLGLVAVSAANHGASSQAAMGAPIVLVGIGAIGQLQAALGSFCNETPANLRQIGQLGRRWTVETLAVPVIARRWGEVYQSAVAGNDGNC